MVMNPTKHKARADAMAKGFEAKLAALEMKHAAERAKLVAQHAQTTALETAAASLTDVSGFTGERLQREVVQLAARILWGTTDNPTVPEDLRRRVWLVAAGISYGVKNMRLATIRDIPQADDVISSQLERVPR